MSMMVHTSSLAEVRAAAISVFNGSLELPEVLTRIVECVAEVLPAHDLSHIMLIEDGVAEIVQQTAYTTLATEVAYSKMNFDINTMPALQNIITGEQPLLIQDTPNSVNTIGFPDTASTSWIRSYLGVPIRVEGKVIGVLGSASADPGCFDSIHAANLQIFADQVGVAIHHAMLYETSLQRVNELANFIEARNAELDLEQKRLEVILDATGEGIFYTENGSIQYVNQRLCVLTGYAPDDLIGQPTAFLRVDSPSKRGASDLYDARRATPENGGVWHGEAELRRKDGTQFLAGMTISLIGIPGTGMLRTVTVVRDISQEKTLEAQKDRFIANASHELRTPITNLKLLLHLLDKQPEAQERLLGLIKRTVNHVGGLTDDLLDLARFERGDIVLQRKPTILQSVIHNVMQLQQVYVENKGVELIANLWEAPVPAHVDPLRITQVLTNLIVNATNYTISGGRITVRLFLDNSSGALNAVIEVSDTGCGIESELLTRIFEPFVRANEKIGRGTGLGLTISREIIRLHGGDLSVESTLDVGSTFTVKLPI